MFHLLVLVLTQPTQDPQEIRFPVPKTERVGTLNSLGNMEPPAGIEPATC
jgi:hypothetical protein